jgi:hypothetical protein
MKKLALVMVLITSICSGCKPHEPSATMAFVQCNKAVSYKLKAPSTAEFGSYTDSDVIPFDTVTNKDGSMSKTFIVSGTVDAQNSFGAMIRNTYTCKIIGLPNDMWKVISLEIN